MKFTRLAFFIIITLLSCNTNTKEASKEKNEVGLTKQEIYSRDLSLTWAKGVRNELNCPIKIGTCHVSVQESKTNSTLLINFFNPSEIEIDAIKFIAKGFDNWGNEVNITDELGLSTVKIFETQTPKQYKNLDDKFSEDFPASSVANGFEVLSLYGVTKIQAYIIKVHFKDGRTWEAD